MKSRAVLIVGPERATPELWTRKVFSAGKGHCLLSVFPRVTRACFLAHRRTNVLVLSLGLGSFYPRGITKRIRKPQVKKTDALAQSALLVTLVLSKQAEPDPSRTGSEHPPGHRVTPLTASLSLPHSLFPEPVFGFDPLCFNHLR